MGTVATILMIAAVGVVLPLILHEVLVARRTREDRHVIQRHPSDDARYRHLDRSKRR